MKSIDLKSLLIGVLATALVVTLMSNHVPEIEKKTELISSPAGLYIYNKETNMLHVYSMFMNKLNTRPIAVYTIAEDGSSLSEIK